MQTSALLQYRIELFAEHMVEGESTLRTAAERLEALELSRNAWTNLKPRSKEYVNLGGSYASYACRGGMFIGYRLVDLTSSGNGTSRSIEFVELPGNRPLKDCVTFTHSDIDLDCSDCELDIQQDLLVLMEVIEYVQFYFLLSYLVYQGFKN